jgi:hypothetical protein
MGMGFAMAQQMAQGMNQQNQPVGAQPVPPPIPTAGYFVAVEGRQTGPFSMEQLAELATSGSLTQDSLVWKSGMENWVPARQVADLAQVFGATPPPVPPPPPQP